MIVAAVTGAGRLVVTEEVSRATLFRIYEQVRSGIDTTSHVVMVDELDTTVEDHYGGYCSTHRMFDTTIDDQPSRGLTSTLSEVVLQTGIVPARVLKFKRGTD